MARTTVPLGDGRTDTAVDAGATVGAAAGAPSMSSTLERGLQVLIALGGDRPKPVAQIAAELNMPTSTVYRFLRSFSRLGMATESSGGMYSVGPNLMALSLGAPLRRHIVDCVEPVLGLLTEQTRETSIATMRVGLSALTVAEVESPNAMRLSFATGGMRPLHAGASATVLLAFGPPRLVEDVARHGLVGFTDATPVTLEALRATIADIREKGYAISDSQVDPDAISVAAPVFRDGRLLFAISAAGPSSRMQPHLDKVIEQVQSAARELTDRLPQDTTIS